MSQYTVFLVEAEEGGYVVTCPMLPGCVSEGETREEAVESIRDAIEGYLVTLRRHHEPLPKVDTETIEVAARPTCQPCGRTMAISTFRKVGYTVDHQTGSHVILYRQGHVPITVPKHNHDLKKGTLYQITRSAGLSVEEFLKLT
jgi:predicted RNase H-like HicB family nuclease/predicted RNA binding protein YcfA (HicA-like mRNA interferase family)